MSHVIPFSSRTTKLCLLLLVWSGVGQGRGASDTASAKQKALDKLDEDCTLEIHKLQRSGGNMPVKNACTEYWSNELEAHHKPPNPPAPSNMPPTDAKPEETIPLEDKCNLIEWFRKKGVLSCDNNLQQLNVFIRVAAPKVFRFSVCRNQQVARSTASGSRRFQATFLTALRSRYVGCEQQKISRLAVVSQSDPLPIETSDCGCSLQSSYLRHNSLCCMTQERR